ncbi:YjbH domain-containing protein [Luteimonas sp. SJ-92]|uniref:YjbH domain-containing protein n=1 Tax=Luteimonas salinisoli TaxID=2752307 RepID=A0A853JAE7_9GAMM|nr:YjbH domain-containing protein [Luteimonas salinisoli]NZA25752.1 YjbH domain-containing protein [Luteimonas salinisoli]
MIPLAGWLLAGGSLASDPAPTQSDFGGAGLWQTPTARMAEEGELSFTANRTRPYSRYNVTMQPLPWLEGSFRYIAVTNRPYGQPSLSGDQSYKDKSIDLKLRLREESRYLPEIAVGGRDLGGTGHFGSEYFVASKRFGPVDASLGLAWGYMGNRGDISNPFSIFGSRFDRRPGRDELPDTGGEFNSATYFRGAPAFFGGISYRLPSRPLVFKLEYEGNDYRSEPHDNDQAQRFPVNLGVVYRIRPHLDLSVALERGNTAMFGLTLHTNVARRSEPAKVLDPPPAVRESAAGRGADTAQVDWEAVSRALEDNAGIRVSRISRRDAELFVTGEQTRYFYPAKGVGRAARIVGNEVGGDIDWFTWVSTREALPVAETSVELSRFDALLAHDIDLDEFRRGVERNPPLPRREHVLYRADPPRFSGGWSLGYSQNIGGPDAFILYQVSAGYQAEYRFRPDLWWSGALNANLLNNYDKFRYTAPSRLPRVRTLVREYLTDSRITMPQFQLTASRRLGTDWYGLAYAGMLESMYGGVGAEVLYRPFGERWAVGADLNWVRQRGFGQDFSFRDYEVATGHVTGYFDTRYRGINVAVSAGRYLAGDWGATFDVSRVFANGARMGAYATFTNVSSRDFGEGSFDKGIYLSIPFDLLQPRSTVNRARFVWAPLIRDGGARLSKRYTLYTLTEDRDGDLFHDNLDRIAD